MLVIFPEYVEVPSKSLMVIPSSPSQLVIAPAEVFTNAPIVAVVEVAIGNRPGCDAWIHQGRVIGCVEVRIGSGYYNYPLRYESR